jgi:hypothetical protein
MQATPAQLQHQVKALTEQNRQLKIKLFEAEKDSFTEKPRTDSPKKIKHAFAAFFLSVQYPAMLKNPAAARSFLASGVAEKMKNDCADDPLVLPHIRSALNRLHEVAKTANAVAA